MFLDSVLSKCTSSHVMRTATCHVQYAYARKPLREIPVDQKFLCDKAFLLKVMLKEHCLYPFLSQLLRTARCDTQELSQGPIALHIG